MRVFGKTGLIVLVALVLAGFVYTVTNSGTNKPAIAGKATAVSDTVKIEIAEINFEKSIGFAEGLTALEATKMATNGELIATGDGFVEEILGKTANKLNREYWELLINGEPALVGARELKLKAGDTIEWKISKF